MSTRGGSQRQRVCLVIQEEKETPGRLSSIPPTTSLGESLPKPVWLSFKNTISAAHVATQQLLERPGMIVGGGRAAARCVAKKRPSSCCCLGLGIGIVLSGFQGRWQ
ncbi:hypothetical protein BDV59DRAFT_186601 [Aspergillus ambiguus]|uniref:uncharacterized protein n=1 Tax=Aspergillus ambiguus TaxID=176160 RepID=UPI003CCE316A